jgi:beta-lactam-binding protein with PASTA domain
MPDLRGRSAREAALTAARRGLVVALEGSGWVISQSPDPGTELEAGMSCRLVLGSERPQAPAPAAPPPANGGTGT